MVLYEPEFLSGVRVFLTFEAIEAIKGDVAGVVILAMAANEATGGAQTFDIANLTFRGKAVSGRLDTLYISVRKGEENLMGVA